MLKVKLTLEQQPFEEEPETHSMLKCMKKKIAKYWKVSWMDLWIPMILDTYYYGKLNHAAGYVTYGGDTYHRRFIAWGVPSRWPTSGDKRFHRRLGVWSGGECTIGLRCRIIRRTGGASKHLAPPVSHPMREAQRNQRRKEASPLVW